MPEVRRVGVILWGLGALGSRVVQGFAQGVQDLEIVGAIDHDPRLANRSLTEAFPGVPAPGVKIHADLASCLASLDEPTDVLFHMTESYVPAIQPQLEEAMRAGLNVVSASEGMFHPGLRFPAVARALHECAVEHDVSIVGCGINPGSYLIPCSSCWRAYHCGNFPLRIPRSGRNRDRPARHRSCRLRTSRR